MALDFISCVFGECSTWGEQQVQPIVILLQRGCSGEHTGKIPKGALSFLLEEVSFL